MTKITLTIPADVDPIRIRAVVLLLNSSTPGNYVRSDRRMFGRGWRLVFRTSQSTALAVRTLADVTAKALR